MAISTEYANFIKSVMTTSFGTQTAYYGVDDLDYDLGSDGRAFISTVVNQKATSVVNSALTNTPYSAVVSTGNASVSDTKMAAVYRDNRTVFLDNIAAGTVATPKVAYTDTILTATDMSGKTMATVGVNIDFADIGPNIIASGYNTFTAHGLRDGFWLMRYISSEATISVTNTSVGGKIFTTVNGPGKLTVELVKVSPVTGKAIKRVQTALITRYSYVAGEDSSTNGFEMPGCLIVNTNSNVFEIISLDDGTNMGSFNSPIPLSGSQPISWLYPQRVLVGDAGDYGSDTNDCYSLIKLSNWAMIDFPAPPTSALSSLSLVPGSTYTLTMTTPSTPAQQHWATPDSPTIRYCIEMWNGSSWVVLLKDTSSSPASITIPTNITPGNRPIRISSGYLWKGTSLYDEKYTTLATTVINNSTPSTPTFVTPLSGVVFNALEKITVDFSDSTDADVGDVVKYDVEFSTDNVNWFVLYTQLTKSEFVFSVPLVSSTTARLRIRSSDGKSYSPYTTSNPFTISAPDLNKQLPNAISLTNADSFVEMSNSLFPTNGSTDFTLEFSFKTDSTVAANRYIFSSKATTGNSVSVYLNATHKLALSIGGTGELASTGTFNDGKIHYGAVIRRGGLLELVVDGVSVGTSGAPTMETLGGDKLFIGRHEDTNTPFIGTIGMLRTWSGIKTLTELENIKNTVTIGTENGLYNYLMFDAATGLLKLGKSPFTVAAMKGDIQWAYRFLPMSDVTIPFPDQTLKKENIEYMRDAVNKFRKANGFQNVTWTDETVIAGVTPVKAEHWNEIQQAIDNVYTEIGQAIRTATVSKGAQIEDVRPTGTSTVTAPVTVSIKDVIEPKKTTFKVNELQYRILMLLKILRGN